VLPSRRIRNTFDCIVINVHPYRSVCVYVQTMHWQLIVVQHWTEFLLLVMRWYCIMLNCVNVKL